MNWKIFSLLNCESTAAIIIAASLGFFAAGCGSEDTLGGKCETACKIEKTHPCFSGYAEICIKECKAKSGQAQKDNGNACAECIADRFGYSVISKDNNPDCENSSDPSCCIGIDPALNNAREDPNMCRPACYPDEDE